MDCYQTICKESLLLPMEARPPEFSRINYDGTPFQLALTLGPQRPSLEYLSEAGIPGSSGADRIRINRERISQVAEILGCREPLRQVSVLLDEIAPAADAELLADPAGAFWIGVGFAVGHRPHLKIYINARWGSEAQMWRRLRRFASHFNVHGSWSALERVVLFDLKPLGMAVTLREGEPPTGRIYLGGYGKLISYYERLMLAVSGENFASTIHQYADAVLAEDWRYPTQSTVCSFGLDAQRRFDTKLELCGHCLFASDVEAFERLQRWLHVAGIDPSSYIDTLAVLSEDRLNGERPELHSYVGVGTSTRGTYSTVYLKPRLFTS